MDISKYQKVLIAIRMCEKPLKPFKGYFFVARVSSVLFCLINLLKLDIYPNYQTCLVLKFKTHSK